MTPSSSAKRRKERRTGTTSGACIARGSGQLAETKLVTSRARTRCHSIAPSRTSEPANRLASLIYRSGRGRAAKPRSGPAYALEGVPAALEQPPPRALGDDEDLRRIAPIRTR